MQVVCTNGVSLGKIDQSFMLLTAQITSIQNPQSVYKLKLGLVLASVALYNTRENLYHAWLVSMESFVCAWANSLVCCLKGQVVNGTIAPASSFLKALWSV